LLTGEGEKMIKLFEELEKDVLEFMEEKSGV
jgi:hypothetical protein